MRSATRWSIPLLLPLSLSLALASTLTAQVKPMHRAESQGRMRARDLGVAPGALPTGANNAITDVPGVRVGQTTVVRGDSVHTGVTAILPHEGNLFAERVPAAIQVGNGFGKLVGVTQVQELGELETPVLLTCTLCVWKAADALAAWMLERPGMESVKSINPVVGETNDGYALNAIRTRPITEADVRRALESASAGPVAEGSVGAGTGTVAFGWKGGIGTSSRVVPAAADTLPDGTKPDRERWTVGVLVQSNYGGDFRVLGAPVGRELGRRGVVRGDQGAKGSVMIVVATDAPLSDRGLRRLATRALLGIGRTGSAMDNGSGDYVIAFSTHPSVRRPYGVQRLATTELGNDAMSDLFEAAVEATEEAVYNSMFMATTVRAKGVTVEALPLPEVQRILQRYGVATRR
ncbi:MAG TPA: P1 family peptidase [Gemmatimonadales bacterium]|nr:P1 family peptidase [Gemmatimonadales bacterium]